MLPNSMAVIFKKKNLVSLKYYVMDLIGFLVVLECYNKRALING